jgi:type IV pilus assembly protein PilF
MKKMIIVLLSLYILSGCQNIPLNSDEIQADDDANLEIRYSEVGQSTSPIAKINTELGAGYIAQGDYERALLKLQKAIKVDSNYAPTHGFLGVLYGQIERPKKAKKSFKKALRLAPHNSSILNNYAIFLCDEKEFDEAKKVFVKVLDNPLYANRVDAYQNAAWCAYSDDDLDQAETLYRKVLDLRKNSPLSLLGLARVSYKQENYNFAWNYFERYHETSALDSDSLWLAINILNNMETADQNLLSSYELQLRNKYSDSDEAKKYFEGREY